MTLYLTVNRLTTHFNVIKMKCKRNLLTADISELSFFGIMAFHFPNFTPMCNKLNQL